MPQDLNSLTPSRRTGAMTILEAFKILKKAGGQLQGKELLKRISEIVNFSEWELSRYEKTGAVRWERLLRFHSIPAVKAGYLIKNKGIWYLTEEGEKAIKLGAYGLLQNMMKSYKAWQVEQKTNTAQDEMPELPDNIEVNQFTLGQLEEQALSGLTEFIAAKTPYEFQEIVGALLRAMGYYIPFIAPKGPDGGIDIVAYQDAFGIKTPHIKVQVKHQPETVIPVEKVRSLIGVLNKDKDMGLFVTTGKFSKGATRYVMASNLHVKLIDYAEFLSLWQQYYNKLTDEEKNMLPLKAIYFLGLSNQ